MKLKFAIAGMLLTTTVLGGAALNNQTVQAKSYATVKTNNYMTTPGTKRNVAPTGTNALYTKAGTLKGAKVVLSKAKMAKLGASKHSKDYFRVYKQATTSRNSVYFKVVSFDGQYRGWVYGGKTLNSFNAGIKSVNTTSPLTLDSTIQNNTYYLLNTASAVTRNYPTMTQYGVSKIMTDPQKYQNVPLTVTKAVTRTREGSTYYYITSKDHPEINGWIWEGYLRTKDNSDSNQVIFNALSDNDVSVSPTQGSGDTMFRIFYAQNVTTANAYQYDANDKSETNQNKIKAALGDGQRIQNGSAYPDSVVKVTFDANGKAHVTLQIGTKLTTDKNFTLENKAKESDKDIAQGALDEFKSTYDSASTTNAISENVFTNDTDTEVYKALFGTETAPTRYSYLTNKNDVNSQVTVSLSVTITRDANGNISNIHLIFGDKVANAN